MIIKDFQMETLILIKIKRCTDHLAKLGFEPKSLWLDIPNSLSKLCCLLKNLSKTL